MSKFATFAALASASTAFAEDYAMMAGYTPGTNVTEHAKIDLDQKDFEEFLAASDWTGALDIYQNGKNSKKTSGMRTLQGFADAAASAKFLRLDEEPHKTFKAYWDGVGDYADRFVLDALNGQGLFDGKEDVFRQECAQKGTAYRNTWMYVIHELEDAIIDCKTGSGNDAAVKAWDEGWAFYSGTLEGTDGSGAGKQPYALAEKRCANFGTCAESGRALLNNKLLELFKDGQKNIDAGECLAADEKKLKIIELMAVPLIQGTLRYAWKLNGKTAEERVTLQKPIAEGLVFAAAVLPAVDAASQSAAAVVRSNMYAVSQNPVVDYEAVKAAFEEAYSGMGITCEDVGALTATETGGDAEEICQDSAFGLSASALLVAATVAASVFAQ